MVGKMPLNLVPFLWSLWHFAHPTRLQEKLSDKSSGEVEQTFDSIKQSLNVDNIHKYVSAKIYFSYRFKIFLNERFMQWDNNNSIGIEIHLNRYKSEFARITKDDMPSDFNDLIQFLLN